MGIFFDLMQQNELDKQQKQADTLVVWVENMEDELASTKQLLSKTLHALEQHLQRNIDGDGSVSG